MPFRALIVEDEPPARADVARLLAQDPRFVLVGVASSGPEALGKIAELSPDLVLLDVQIPGLDGFDLLDALPEVPEFAVVLSADHDEHALRAFEVGAVDYLLKPHEPQRFLRALDRVVARVTRGRAADFAALRETRPRKRLVVRAEGAWVPVALDELFRATAEGKRVRLHTSAGPLSVRASLSALESQLDPASFVRAHRGEIVRLDAIERLEPGSHGDGVLVLKDGSGVVLSRTHRHELLRRWRAR